MRQGLPAGEAVLGECPMTPPVTDHIRLWADELAGWLPHQVFDAHVHVGPPEAAGPVPPERRRTALLTFTSQPWESFAETWAGLFPGRRLTGVFALPFPQREIRLDAANDYLIELMQREPRARGFLLADPHDPAPVIRAFERGLAAGVRFTGVKPYADRLGKSNFAATMDEFLPDSLLEFMDAQGLVMLLHTAGAGVGEPAVQSFLRRMGRRWPRVRAVLAHMGRYVQPRQFLDFLASGVLEECPMLFLETSSASVPEVYQKTLEREWLRPRLVFGSDLPFGLITGVEHWSESHGATFLTRDLYPWTDPGMAAALAEERNRLTYNTYHTIKAVKDGMERAGISGPEAETLKDLIFRRTAEKLVAPAGPCPGRSGIPHGP